MASHIGKLPIAIPNGVEASVNGSTVSIKGSKGTDEVTLPERITVEIKDNEIIVNAADNERETRAQHGLVRALLAAKVKGVSEGYQKHLLIVGTGYRVQAKGKGLEFALGYSHTITVNAPEGITFEVPNQNEIFVKGTDKQLVGQVAANIRKLRAPEPYKGKGIKYEDEHILRKAGKAGK